MENDNITEETVDTPSEALPSDAELGSVDGEETVTGNDAPEAEAADAISLKELNEQLGRNYKDKDSAIKSLKDTRKAATQKVEQAEVAKVDPSLAEEIKALKEDNFYTNNPEYKAMRPLISKMGDSPSEVVQTDEFKTVFEQVQGYQKNQESKSVLETNPKLGQVKDSMSEAREQSKAAREALKQGDIATAIHEQGAATGKAVGAVLEAYETDKI